jgi:hypothetical protein
MRQSARQRPEPHIQKSKVHDISGSLGVGRILVPSTHRACRLLAGLAPRVHRLASRPLCRATLSVRSRTFGSPLAPGSQTAPSGHSAAQYRPGVARAWSLGVVPVGGSSAGEHGKGSRGVRGTVRHRTASPQRLYLAGRVHCHSASSRGVSSIYQTQDQCPSLAPARAVGGGTPLGLGGFLPPLDDSKGAWTNFEPSRPSPHTTPHRIRACLPEALAP